MSSDHDFRMLAFRVCADERDYLKSIRWLFWLILNLPLIAIEAMVFSWRVSTSRRMFRGIALPGALMFFGLVTMAVVSFMLADIVFNALNGRLTNICFKTGTLEDIGLPRE